MKRYRIRISMPSFKTIEIGAKNEEEAEKKAFEILEIDNQPDEWEDFEIDEIEEDS